MLITEKQLNEYRSQLAELEDAAGEFITEYLQAFRAAFPRASVADIREATKDAIEDVLNAFGTEAGVLSNELFDKVCKAEGINATAELYDAIDRDILDGKVRYFARDLVKGNSRAFTRNVTDLSCFYVKRNAYENMVRNCARNEIRYARVPSGLETCGFCFMLCSRGFVYHSEKSADITHGLHAHCDCIIVPGVNGVTKISGYEPEEMYKRWKLCEQTIGGEDALSEQWESLSIKQQNKYKGDTEAAKKRDFFNKQIMKEAETRDFKWLYSGIEPPVDYSEIPRSKFGTLIKERDYSKANIKNRGNEWRDLVIHDTFSQCGFSIKPLEANAPKGYKNIDSFLNGKLCEMKSPNGVLNLESKDPYRFVEKNLRTAKEQFEKRYDESTGGLPKKVGQIRVIFNTFYHNGDDDEIAKRLSIEMKKHGINEVFLLDKAKKIRRIK